MSRDRWISKVIFLLTMPVILPAACLRLTVAAQASSANTFQETLKRAEADSLLKQWAEASARWSQVVEANPHVGSYWKQMGIARYNNKDYRGEIKKSKICKELFSGQEYLLPMSAEEKRAAFPVRLIDVPERQVAYIRVTNAFEMDRVLTALKTMIEWAKSQDIFSQGTLFGMSVDDPHVTPKHLYRYEVCFASSLPFGCMKGMSKLKMPAMRYAATRVSGDIRKVTTATDYLFRGWLIHSDYEPEHAPGLEIFLDKEKAMDWSHFELELCILVRKLAERRSQNEIYKDESG